MRGRLTLALGVALVGVGWRDASPDDPPKTRDVSGRVVVADVEPVQALANVDVEWFDPAASGPVPPRQRTVTNDAGLYEFKAVPARSVRMRYRPQLAEGDADTVRFAVFAPLDRVCLDDPRCLEWDLGNADVDDVAFVRAIPRPTDPAAVADARVESTRRASAIAAYVRNAARRAADERTRQTEYAAALERLRAVGYPASDRLAVAGDLWEGEKEIPASRLKALGIELADSVNTPERVRDVASLLFDTEIAVAATIKAEQRDARWPTLVAYRTAHVAPKTLAHALEEQLVAYRRRGLEPLDEAEILAVLRQQYGSTSEYFEEVRRVLPGGVAVPDGVK